MNRQDAHYVGSTRDHTLTRLHSKNPALSNASYYYNRELSDELVQMRKMFKRIMEICPEEELLAWSVVLRIYFRSSTLKVLGK